MADMRKNKSKLTGDLNEKIAKRRRLSFDEKMTILKRHEKGESLAEIGRSLALNRSTIGTIIKDKKRIMEHVNSGGDLNKMVSCTRVRPNIMEEMEHLLKLWIDDQMRRNVSLNLSIIQTKAKALYSELKSQMGENSGEVEPFGASWGWFRRFKIRSKLHSIKVPSEAASTDVESTDDFSKQMIEISEEGENSSQLLSTSDGKDIRNYRGNEKKNESEILFPLNEELLEMPEEESYSNIHPGINTADTSDDVTNEEDAEIDVEVNAANLVVPVISTYLLQSTVPYSRESAEMSSESHMDNTFETSSIREGPTRGQNSRTFPTHSITYAESLITDLMELIREGNEIQRERLEVEKQRLKLEENQSNCLMALLKKIEKN